MDSGNGSIAKQRDNAARLISNFPVDNDSGEVFSVLSSFTFSSFLYALYKYGLLLKSIQETLIFVMDLIF